MNKYVKAVGESSNRQALKKSFAPQAAADEDLRKRVRRVVKSVSVPADLESKILNFIFHKEKGANLIIQVKDSETTRQSASSDPLEWFELYGDYLFAYARRRVRNQTAAEDLVQETFLAALSANGAFAGKSSEKTWLTGILKHKIYDYFGKHSRQAELTPEESDLSGYDYLFDRGGEWDAHWNDKYAPVDWENASPLRRVEESEFQVVFSVCLMGLPERIANAFVMREVDGLTSAEICGILTISTNNYWTMMHRARLHLRRCLEVNWFAAVN